MLLLLRGESAQFRRNRKKQRVSVEILVFFHVVFMSCFSPPVFLDDSLHPHQFKGHTLSFTVSSTKKKLQTTMPSTHQLLTAFLGSAVAVGQLSAGGGLSPIALGGVADPSLVAGTAETARPDGSPDARRLEPQASSGALRTVGVSILPQTACPFSPIGAPSSPQRYWLGP